MTDQCLDPRELDLVLRLPEDDPRREHLNRCPSCRGLLRAMEAFLEPGDTADLGDVGAADSELAARMTTSLSKSRNFAPRPRMRRFGLAAAAALALVAVGLTASEVMRMENPAGLAPGQHQRGPDATAGISMIAADGELRLSWPAAPLADEVVYIFFADDMSQLGQLGTSGTLVLHDDDPLALAPFCQALAVAQGDTIGRSGISRLAPDRE